MKSYRVTMPLTGAIHLYVQAENPKEALERAWAQIMEGAANEPGADIEWEFTEKVSEGNVCRAMYDRACVSRIPDSEPQTNNRDQDPSA